MDFKTVQMCIDMQPLRDCYPLLQVNHHQDGLHKRKTPTQCNRAGVVGLEERRDKITKLEQAVQWMIRSLFTS
jgi:hypothetical protein